MTSQPDIGGDGHAMGAICTPDSMRRCCFLYKYEPSTSMTGSCSDFACWILAKEFHDINAPDYYTQLTYLSTSCFFFHDVGALIPRHRSHHLSCGIVWRSIGSFKSAPGMSDSVSCTACAWILSWLLLGISVTLISTNNSRSALATAIALEQTSYNVARLLFSLGVL